MAKHVAVDRVARYAEIDEIVKNDDGTIVVSGYASSGAEDSDGEVITPDAMSAAIPDYMKFGAVREMHGKSAAGTAIEAEVQEDGRTTFTALIVDPIAIKKVETGTYKGFSIGGKVTSRDPLNKTIITGLNLIEVSLVDRPANPEALITMFKADELDKENTTSNEGEKPEVAEKSEGATDIKKGIYSLKDFAGVLQTISWICSDAAYEATYEGDNSPVPAQLRDWVAQGVAIFKAMAEEELNEMMATLNAIVPAVTVVETVELSAGTDIEKAGAKFSSTVKSALAELHKMADDMSAKFAGLGYKDAEEEEEKSESVEVVKGEATDPEETNANDDLTKALDLAKSDLEKAQAANAELTESLAKSNARIAELEREPETPKVHRLQTPISKAQDNGLTNEGEPEPPKGTEEHLLWTMKSIHNGTLTKTQ